MLVLALQVILFGHLVWLSLYTFGRGERRGAAVVTASALGQLALAVVLYAMYLDSSPYEQMDAVVAALAVWAVGSMITGLLIAYDRFPGSQGDAVAESGGVVIIPWAIPAALAYFVTSSGRYEVPWIGLAALGVVFLAGGLLVAKRLSDANGEALAPDLFRSYDYSLLISVVFGGQVVIAMWSGPGATDAMVALLLGTITAAVAIQVYLDRVQSLLDKVAFANVPWLRHERAELRRIENLLPRVNMTDPLAIPEEEFAKLTRRALSNYGDLTKLATSPLTNLPEVHRRLLARAAEPSTLERARELKLVLAEAIERLKPRNGEEFGTTDEWRFYNALYYPYIVGMRPYSSTAVHSFDVPEHFDVLEWFRTYVPERTLYNWQNSAAVLVAGHLREQEESAVSTGTAPSPELTSIS